MRNTIIAAIFLGASAICAPMAFLPARNTTVSHHTFSSTAHVSSHNTSVENRASTTAMTSIPIVQTASSTRPVSPVLTSTVKTTVSDSAVPAPISVDKTVTIGVEDNGELLAMTLEEYLCGVTAGEMPATFPTAALEAQVIAARTLVLKHLYGEACHATGALVCTDYHHCAAFCDFSELSEENATAIRDAVRATDGKVLLYDGEPITAAFHAISGGMTEASADVWGGDYPYLTNVLSPGEENAKNFRTEHVFTADEFAKHILSAYPDADLSGPCSEWFRNSKRSPAGGIITVFIGGISVKGTQLRTLLDLPSTDFTVIADDEKRTLTLICTGFGHGVGLSQYGAAAFAEDGWTGEEIVTYYYPGTIISDKLSLWTDFAE